MSDPVNIHVIEDDGDMRTALVTLLVSYDYQVCAFPTAKDFLASRPPAREGPECLVLDLRLPELSGLDLQEELARAGDPIPIVFITGAGDVPTTAQAMKAGAVDFLPKPLDPAALLDAVQRAIERDARQRSEAAELEELRRRFARLTPRQCDVLAYLVTGRSNKQIAAALGTVEQTIKFHRAAIMRRLAVGSLAEVVRLVYRAAGQPWAPAGPVAAIEGRLPEAQRGNVGGKIPSTEPR